MKRVLTLSLLCAPCCSPHSGEGQPAASVPGGSKGHAGGAEKPPGLWYQVRSAPQDAPGELDAIGYLQGYREAPGRQGVRIHDPDRVAPGLNLYQSGHAAEAILIESDGRELHRWSCPFDRLYPDFDASSRRTVDGQFFWIRTHLFDNGDLLAIYDGFALVKLDRESNVLWSYDRKPHHDLHVAGDGTLWVLVREARPVPELGREEPVLDDFLAQLGQSGEELRRISLLECFLRSPFAHLLEHGPKDLFHTNKIEWLTGSVADLHPAFQAGRVLVSCRNLSTLAVLDLEREEVVWAVQGLDPALLNQPLDKALVRFRAQHHPTILQNGNLLLFDNLGAAMDEPVSRVLELRLPDLEVVWSHAGSARQPFFTATLGAQQRLAGGNTLITESEAGRAFEVTASGEIVWELVNPHRAGPQEELIATLLEVRRLPRERFDWLPRAGDE